MSHSHWHMLLLVLLAGAVGALAYELRLDRPARERGPVSPQARTYTNSLVILIALCVAGLILT